MPYTPKIWKNKPSTASPINATNLNHMEGGIKTNDDNIADAQNAILTLQGEMLQAQGDISALETLVDSIFPVDTEMGNPAVITDAFGGACKSLKLTLEPIQSGSGTPSPQNVRPITGRTQSVVVRTGLNVLPSGEAKSETLNNVTATCDGNGNYTVTTTGSTLGTVFTFACDEFTIPDGQAFTLGLMNDGTPSNVSFGFSYNGVSIDNWTLSSINRTSHYIGMSEKKCNQLTINIYNNTAFTLHLSPMIYYGDIADFPSIYEAYNGESITRTYGTTLYGGTDDVTGDGATKTKDLYVPVVSSVGYSSSAGCNYADCHGITVVEDSDTICNMYDQIPYGNTGAEGKYKIYPSTITIYDSRFTDVATAQSILNSCQIVYPLYTPTSVPLTAQNVTLLHGDNVLTTDADSIEASYSADIALYIDKKIAEGSQGNRSLSKGGVSEEEPKEEEKKEEIETKEAEPLNKEVR